MRHVAEERILRAIAQKALKEGMVRDSATERTHAQQPAIAR
jgi:hypothetical protein